MARNWWFKAGFLLVVTTLAAILVVPVAAPKVAQRVGLTARKKMNLGLDLQGGVYMVLGVDLNRAYDHVVARLTEDLIVTIKKLEANCTVAKAESSVAEDPRLLVKCVDEAVRRKVQDGVQKNFDSLRVVDDRGTEFELGLSRLFQERVQEKTISQSVEVIRNRIDEFEVAEPVISVQSSSRISVELPGVSNLEHAKELIGRSAHLEFKTVDQGHMSPDDVAALVSEIEAKNGLAYHEGERFSDYVQKVNELAKGKVPAHTEIAFEREGRRANSGGTLGRIAHLLESKAMVTGADVKDVLVQPDPRDGRPFVTIVFNERGSAVLTELSAKKENSVIAIVLDGIVHSVPSFKAPISDGHIQVAVGSGDYNQSLRDARNLATILRAGSVPTTLDFLEQRVVGPSLGADSIKRVKTGCILGCLAVFVFMLFVYRVSGLIADISLALNVLFVFALFVFFDASLTLPGIAAIALTVGIAVDSNVVIYERIREELRSGKTPKVAVAMAFRKAMRTIIDANVASSIAGLVLFYYGTSSVRSFALTMLFGVVTTLFTAVFVCRMLFDWYIDRFDVRELSI